MRLYQKIATFSGRKLPGPLFRFALKVGILYKNIVMPEQKKSYGVLNPDKIFYVIRLYSPSGFLGCYNFVLGYMRHAFENGWIPVIDMENYSTCYSADVDIHGTNNVWEYMFKQPYDKKTGRRYSLDEVYKSKYVILSNGTENFYNDLGDENTIDWQYEMSKLVPLQDDISERANRIYSELYSTERINAGIIGCSIRGTDLSQRVVGHAIQASPMEIVEALKKCSIEWDEKSAFIVAEEEKMLNILESNGIDFFCMTMDRVKNYDGKVSAAEAGNMNGVYQNLSNYIINVWLLSKCDSLLGTMNNGMYTAMIWNGNRYKHVLVIDKGVYK